MLSRLFSPQGLPGPLLLAVFLAICPLPAARAANAPDLVGVWHAAGNDGSATLEFQGGGVVLLRAGGRVTRGSYRVDNRQQPMELTLDLPPGGPQRWAVEFAGPNEFRQEKLAPQARVPAHLGKGAMLFVRAGLESADTAITPPTDGSRVTSKTNPAVTALALRTIVAYERKKPGGKALAEPVVVSQDPASTIQAAEKDKAGKAVGYWLEVWSVRFEQNRTRRYSLDFHTMGARGTTVEIRPIGDGF